MPTCIIFGEKQLEDINEKNILRFAATGSKWRMVATTPQEQRAQQGLAKLVIRQVRWVGGHLRSHDEREINMYNMVFWDPILLHVPYYITNPIFIQSFALQPC